MIAAALISSIVLVIIIFIINVLKFRVGYIILGSLLLLAITLGASAGGTAFKN